MVYHILVIFARKKGAIYPFDKLRTGLIPKDAQVFLRQTYSVCQLYQIEVEQNLPELIQGIG
jgi:hypothetical protein